MYKRNDALAMKYLKDNVLTMQFERKFEVYETMGEMSMSLNHVRTTSVLAKTDVHVLTLNQRGYERVFAELIEEVREKLIFFLD